MQQERGVGEFGQRAIGQFLGERARTEKLAESRRAEKVALGETEKKALATVRARELKTAATRAKEERVITEQKRREGVRAEAAAIPSPQTTQQIALEKAKLDKMTADVESSGGPEALTPSQSLALNKQLLKSKSQASEFPENPASQADMDFVNRFGNEAMYLRQIEVRDPNFFLPSGLEGTQLKGQEIPLPRGLTMDRIRAAAEKNGVDIETILRALPELKQYFQG